MKKSHKINFLKAFLMLLTTFIMVAQLATNTIADSGSTSSIDALNGYDQDTSSTKEFSSNINSNTQNDTSEKIIEGPYVPNESGEVMVLMFHHFIENYAGGDRKNTITLDGFQDFLQKIYDQGYRPVSMEDLIQNTINLPKGYRPIVFTFDDGWASQFSFIENNGELIVDPNTAVGILEEFNRTHPDFDLKGMFFVNLGQNTFGKVGSVEERLNYLINKGFEIGNHTYKHDSLKTLDSFGINEEVGKNQLIMDQLVPGYRFSALALPYGSNNKPLIDVIARGTYGGVEYNNQIVFLAGWKPTEIPGTTGATYVSTRIIAPGLDPLEMDANWWLEDAKKNPSRYYVSDGNPEIVTIPENKIDLLTKETCETRNILITSAI